MIMHSILVPSPVQSLAQYHSHLHELLEGFKLEEFAFCDQLLRITLLQKTEKRTVHLGDGEGIQTNPPETQLVPRKYTDIGFKTTTSRKTSAS